MQKQPIINYSLEAKDKNPNNRVKPELIIAMIHANFAAQVDSKIKYDRVKVSLQCRILPKNFGLIQENFRKNDDIFNNFSKQNKSVKTVIDLFEAKVNDTFIYFKTLDVEPTAKQFKTELFVRLKREDRVVKKEITLSVYLTDKIAFFEGIIDSGNKQRIEEGSIKIYRTIKGYIEKYEEFKNIKLTFSDFDVATYWDFWIVQDEILKGNIKLPKKEGERKQSIKPNGFLMSSINKYQKSLLRLMSLAHDDGNIVKLNFRDENLIVDRPKSSKDLYLRESDLLKIHDYQATNNDMQLAKDYVLLASLTGMRFESMEIAHLEKIEVHKDSKYDFSYIHSKQNKTSTECYIPLFAPVLGILEKYNNSFPKFPPNQILNSDLKILFKEANVVANENITTHTYRSGIKKESKPSNEIISTHDCRKAFYSNLMNMLVDENIINSVTHPSRTTSHAMGKVYDKRNLLDKAKKFVDELNNIQESNPSELYRF